MFFTVRAGSQVCVALSNLLTLATPHNTYKQQANKQSFHGSTVSSQLRGSRSPVSTARLVRQTEGRDLLVAQQPGNVVHTDARRRDPDGLWNWIPHQGW